MKIGGQAQIDTTGFASDGSQPVELEGDVEWRRARAYALGSFRKRWSFKFQWDFTNDKDITGGKPTEFSFAFNWYPTYTTRVSFNVVRAARETWETVWIFQGRLQLAL